jgi:hypothetical protein
MATLVTGTGNNNYYIDASILSILRSMGYILTPAAFSADYIAGSFQLIEKVIVGGRSIPAFMDSSGYVYVISDSGVTYVLSKLDVPTVTDSPTRPRGVSDGPSGGFNPPINTPTMGPPTPPPASLGGRIGSGQIYNRFDIDDVVPNQQEVVTRGLWSNNVGTLLTFYTSSVQTSQQKRYYYEIYNSSSIDDCGSEPQFSVVYGNSKGSGSNDDGGQIEDTPTRAIYGQYRLLCLDPTEQHFTFNGVSTDSIYAININRTRMMEYVDEGNLEINIAHLSGSEYIAGGGDPDTYTGSLVGVAGTGQVLRLIDDSRVNPAILKQSGEVYNIVSGSIEDGIYNPSNPHVYGQLFKRKGIIVLDGNKLDVSASFGTVVGQEVEGDNAFKLFTAISGAALYQDGSGDYLGFSGRGAEVVKSTHYFVRARNAEYNFSNNPTFTTGSSGDLRHPEMINDPKTYITTVGLYNDKWDLIAVAKMSKPVEKSFKEEALIKVKLDF